MRISVGTITKNGYTDFGTNYKNMLNEIDDGECQEIYGLDFLDYVPIDDFEIVINGLIAKMRHECILLLGGTDLIESAKQLLRGDLGVTSFNQCVYGDKIPKKGQYSLQFITDKLLSAGLKVQRKNLEWNNFFVEVVRP